MARFLFLMLWMVNSFAQDSDLDRRVHAVAAELRCLVCQNQTLAESNAPLAIDMRNQIREQMKAGANYSKPSQFYAVYVGFRCAYDG